MSDQDPWAGLAYANLRRGGAPAWRATSELGLGVSFGRRCETALKNRLNRDGPRPRFCRDEAHVAAVRAAGGYPAIGP
jgi:hypothetical protein